MVDLSCEEYLDKLYAGVLGKIIGVYMGRPVEGWTYEKISKTFGEITTYVYERVGQPLVVADDDISGTFTFIRALEDYGYPSDILPAQVGQTWLNYLVEGKTILWWGGRGNSTEHTAYLNLKEGVNAPESGSLARNGSTTANQIGAMIFIDAWAMVSPGDPAKASARARAAASVSHDDEALNAAAFIAAIEAAAFNVSDIDELIDIALAYVPSDSAIASIVSELRSLRKQEPNWRAARVWLDEAHGYHRYPGSCHVLPNFGLILLSLLYGEGDFRKSMTIVNTSGWDTDCNAANLGCLLGIRGGLRAIESCPDLRFPPRDSMYISSADGGRAITDAAREALSIAATRYRMEGESFERPKGGARFPFAFPGALHGFHAVAAREIDGDTHLETIAADRGNALEIRFGDGGKPGAISTPVFIPPDYKPQSSYDLQASPSLYPGQRVVGRVFAPGDNRGSVKARLFVGAYRADGDIARSFAEWTIVVPGEWRELAWVVEVGSDYPIFELGLELESSISGEARLILDCLDWSGVPKIEWSREKGRPSVWEHTWVQAVDQWSTQFPESFRLSQNQGTGLLIQGMREWRDYSVSAPISIYGAKRAGIAARVQGLRRYYALVLARGDRIQLIRELDGTTVLAETGLALGEPKAHSLGLRVDGEHILASVDRAVIFDLVDPVSSLGTGAVGYIVEEGTLLSDCMAIAPL
jgi:ADP-ribosylglycohydrolase